MTNCSECLSGTVCSKCNTGTYLSADKKSCGVCYSSSYINLAGTNCVRNVFNIYLMKVTSCLNDDNGHYISADTKSCKVSCEDGEYLDSGACKYCNTSMVFYFLFKFVNKYCFFFKKNKAILH